MKRRILDMLICPACLPDEVPLRVAENESTGAEIVEGTLSCPRCASVYPIRDGVAKLFPPGPEATSGSVARYEDPGVISSYLWSHFADLFKDPEAVPAYPQWAGEFSAARGAALDAGCAVGRFTFEMARKYDLAIGLDRSEGFIRAARDILRSRRLVFQVKEEGQIRSEREIVLPENWQSLEVEFIAGDAQALPFRSGSFSGVASLNLLDKVSRPLTHLKEASRVARPLGAQLLVSDPFSWSEDVCPPEDWLGGTLEGECTGRAMENVSRLLSGGAAVSPPWKIARQGAVWWKIRNHSNHFELIRSVFIKAERR